MAAFLRGFVILARILNIFIDWPMSNEGMSNVTTVLGLLNGMIGGTILVLPILGLSTGYVNTLIICICIGAIEFYTAYLIVLHLGKSKSIKECIYLHFNQDTKYVKIYSLIVWSAFAFVFLIYFRLIVLQIQGLMGYSSPFIAPICAFLLFLAAVFVRIYESGEEILAFGIFSIIIYIGFLFWAQYTAPQGERKVPPFGEIYPLTSSLTMAYSIHNFVSQNIFKNPNKNDYVKIVGITYLCGIVAYTFITYGSFAIVNRNPLKEHPQTIQDYFSVGGWQITIIQLLYLVHLLSAFPNFLIISKVRFFELFEIEEKKAISWQEILYIFVVIGAALAIFLLGVHLQILIEVKGAVIGFLYVFLIPIALHFKCVFIDQSSGFIEESDERNMKIKMNACECDNHYSSKWTLHLQTALLIFILIIGIVLMVNTLAGISKN